MAVFNSAIIGNMDQAQDIKQVKSYLYRLNEELRYMFANLTPDDNNASGVPKITFVKDGSKEASFQISMDGMEMNVASDEYVKSNVKILSDQISSEVTRATGAEGTLSSRITQNADQIALRVKSSDLGNSSLTIKPALIDLTSSGSIKLNATNQLIINSGNLKIDSAGNATFSGALSAATGSFKGSINVNNGAFSVSSNGDVVAKNITIGDGVSQGSVAYFGTLLSDSASFHTLVVSENTEMDYLMCAQLDCNSTITCSMIYSSAAGEWWSDSRLKENIKDLSMEDSVEILKAIRPVTFNLIESPGKDHMGMIAQEVKQVMEDRGINLPLYGTAPNGYYTIPYTNFIPMLIKAVQYLLEDKK